MKKTKLGDLYTITSGGTPSKRQNKYYDAGNIRWVKTGDLKQKYLYECEEYITQEGLANSSAKMYEPGTVLIAMYGATIGAVSILQVNACTNQACAAFPAIDDVIPEYLYYFFRSQKARFCKDGVGGAQPNISVGYLKSVEMNFIDIDEQRKIIECLSKVESIIAYRKHQINKLNSLIKSRFIEMFGDPIENTKGWRKDLLANVTSKIGSGATPKGGKESYQSEGITLIRSMNVYDSRFEYKDLAHITDQQALQLDNATVMENDVLINITGASVARSCVVPVQVLSARVNQHVAIIRCIKEWLNPIFANQMFVNNSFKNQLISIGESGGATRQAITKQQLEMLNVILPPLELQQKFAIFAVQVDKSKNLIQQSMNEAQLLFDVLMQKYFG